MKNAVRMAVEAYSLNPRFPGRSVASLARELGVSRSTIYFWIRRGEVPLRHLDAFSTVTECSPVLLNATARKGYEIAKAER